MNYVRTLQVMALESSLSVRLPEADKLLTNESPALELLTDFAHSIPPMLESGTSLADAEQLMRREHANLKIIIGQGEAFRGILTLLDIHSSRTLKMANAMKVERKDLTVADVMIPRNELHAIDQDTLASANVGQVAELLQALGERFLLVVDHANSVLVGLISARDLTRRLNVPDFVAGPAKSFSEIQAALAKH